MDIIKHLTQNHQCVLLSEEKISTDNEIIIECFGCMLPITSGPSYRCIQCKDLALHKTCVELPLQISHPFHPTHALFLIRCINQNRCNFCQKQSKGLFYRCKICDFDLDTDCIQITPTIKYPQGHHPDHLLYLFNNNNSSLASDSIQFCSACWTKCNGLVLRCIPCDFNLHVSCLPLTVKDKNHKHALTLITTSVVENEDGLGSSSGGYYCGACKEKRNPDEPVYYCAGCHYVSHIGCVVSEVDSNDRGTDFKHFSHDHILTLSSEEKMIDINNSKNNNNEVRVDCFGCSRPAGISRRPTYRCIQCKDFALHKSCAEFPRKINNHPFHPSHPLILIRRSDRNWCNSCRKPCKGFYFRCDICNFDLDTDCARLSPTIKYQGHPSHLLSLFSNNSSLASDYSQVCSACQTKCNGLVLRCVPCDFNLHVSCLPRTVRHKNHRHFLTLTTSAVENDGSYEFYCGICDEKKNPNEPAYYCTKCQYVVHIGCIVEAIADQQESDAVAPTRKFGTIVFADPFFIKLHEEMAKLRIDLDTKVADLNKLKKEVSLIRSKLRFLEGEIPRKYNQTSQEFPQKIKHPFHSQHPLTLTLGQDDFVYYNCSVCMKRRRGFRYHCSKCDFFLDTDCVLRKPTIKYNGHQQHLLIFLKKIYADDHKCDACNEVCKTAPILRCADCNFNLHIDCFPSLPQTFKNPQFHLHTLTLTDSFVDDPSADEFYCDSCEDERDPKLPVYLCEECHFVSHVTCIISEELPSIIAELDSTKMDEVVEKSVFVDVSNDKIEDEIGYEDPTLAKLDTEMAELQAELEEVGRKRARHLAGVF